MNPIEMNQTEYESWRAGSEVTAADHFGDKVLRLEDGTYLKLFRVKRLLTSARFNPYWRRFATNAASLARLGIPTLEVRDIYAIPHLDRTAVHYDPLPGLTLREVDVVDEALIIRLGQFIGQLHEKGVYLRSMHLGNVVQTPAGDLGLIDVADMKIRSGPLPRRLRIRNFDHLCRYVEDRVVVARFADVFIAQFEAPLRSRMMQMLMKPA